MLGKTVADAIEARLRADVPAFIERHGLVPTLAIVLVGQNAASERYVKKKIEACARLGMRADLKAAVAAISASRDYHGVLVQLPLPRALEEHDAATTNKFDIFDAVAGEKDVDGVG